MFWLEALGVEPLQSLHAKWVYEVRDKASIQFRTDFRVRRRSVWRWGRASRAPGVRRSYLE